MATGFGVVCPGQGAQHPCMFDLARSNPVLSRELDRWLRDISPGIAWPGILSDPDALFGNLAAQPLIVAATLIVWQGLSRHLPPPELVAGYSVGEVAACSIAGALTPARAVRLAAVRARHMQEGIDPATGQQGMRAVHGLNRASIDALCRRCDAFVSIVNGEDAVIVGGLEARLPALEAMVAEQGGSTRRLRVSVASHTPFMAQSAAMLQSTLADPAFAFAHPAVPLAAGVDGSLLHTAASLRHNLVRQLAEPLDWSACMDTFAERGITTLLELGPGDTLTRLLRNRHPRIAARSVSDFRSIEGAAKWVTAHLQ